jgi:thiamine-monophosphate kinase
VSGRHPSPDTRVTTVGDFTERELIGRIQHRLPPPPDWLLVGVGDDAAVVEPERNRVEVLSVDCLVDGVHFDRAFVPPDAIGHRALAVNLSDLAAMGATPRLALVSLALPSTLAIADFDGMAGGLCALAARHRTHIVGGNITRTPGPLTIDITVSGAIKRRRSLTRGGARPGDDLYVSGSIGSAAVGLKILRSPSPALNPGGPTAAPAVGWNPGVPTAAPAVGWNSQSNLIDRYLRPEPRVRLGTLLARNRAASACIDLSDGLADGLRQIADASGVGVRIDADAVPIDPGARDWFTRAGKDPVFEAMAGGDDYELLFAVRPRLRRRLQALIPIAGVPLTRIGTCTAEPGATVARAVAGAPEMSPIPAGYRHFR